MISISYRKLKYAAVAFAAVQIAGFFFGWLSVVWAVIFTFMLAAAIFFSYRSHSDEDSEYSRIEISPKALIGLLILSLVWCFVAGQGGFVRQTGDHATRNMIIADMTLKKWPVTYHDDSNMLCYYICYWIIPCGIGRIFYTITENASLALRISNIMLLIQSTIGCYITLLLAALVTQPRKKAMPFASALLFIFFSGLDIIGDKITNIDHEALNHIEWWAAFFQFSSINTGLFWVYNQTVPVWPFILCLMNEKKCRDFAFLALLAFPFGPFPFVGMFIFCVTKAVFIFIDSFKEKKLKEEIIRTLSPQNFIVCISVFAVFALYFTSSVLLVSDGGSSVNTGFRFHDLLTHPGNDPTVGQFIIRYIEFILIEIMIYSIILIIKDKQNRKMVIATTAALMLIPLFQIGYQYDFGMRVSIPGIMFIAVLFIRYLLENASSYEKFELEKILRTNPAFFAACFIFVIGAGTPFIEMATTVKRTIEIHTAGMGETAGFDYDHLYIYTLETDESQTGNFFAQNYKNSVFYKAFMRKE